MKRCFIGLGANLDDPAHQIAVALHALSGLPQSRLLRWSSLYGSRPMGPQDQPDYVNAVAEIETSLTPLALLDALKAQEQQQGRTKLRHWGERCIDLDILLYADLTMTSERLTIPHAGLQERAFVVKPLLELEPQLRLPDGTDLSSLTPRYGEPLHRLYHPSPEDSQS